MAIISFCRVVVGFLEMLIQILVLMDRFWTFLSHVHSLAAPVLMLLYPLYASVMAIESPTKVDDEQWLAYWMLYSLLTLTEMLLEPILQWIPIWYGVKLMFVAWLVLPQFRGSAFIYDRFVRKYTKQYNSIPATTESDHMRDHQSNRNTSKRPSKSRAFIDDRFVRKCIKHYTSIPATKESDHLRDHQSNRNTSKQPSKSRAFIYDMFVWKYIKQHTSIPETTEPDHLRDHQSNHNTSKQPSKSSSGKAKKKFLQFLTSKKRRKQKKENIADENPNACSCDVKVKVMS